MVPAMYAVVRILTFCIVEVVRLIGAVRVGS
jgi:hypothetical protein